MGTVSSIEDGRFWKWTKDDEAVMALEKELEEEERKDPELKKLADDIDRVVFRANFYAHIDERRAAEGKPPLRRRR